MPTTNKLVSAPQRERAIAVALHVAAKEIANSVATTIPTCLNCQWFDEPSEHCGLARARPPAKVIAFGCPSYDGIPF